MALLLTIMSASLQQPWRPAEFPISYWLGPPATHNTLENWRVVRDCNFTVAGPGWGYALDENRKALDLCHQVGLKALVLDPRITWEMTAYDDWKETVRQIVADYGSHPATYGYFLMDEPSYQHFKALALLNEEFRRLDPAHLPYINLFPTYASVAQLGTPTYADYLEKFLSIVKPSVLSYDHYCLLADGSNRPGYFENLAMIREYGLRYGVPPWNIIQSCSYHPSVRDPSAVDMRWQVYTSLAYGMKGIMYFIYWGSVVDNDGKPARLYPVLQQLNSEMKVLGKVLLGLTSTGVFHTGEVPQGATRLGGEWAISLPQDVPLVIGFFRDPGGVEYAMIVNNSYAQPVSFEARFLPHVVGVTEIRASDGSEAAVPLNDHRASFALEPGDGKLLRLTTQFAYAEPPRALEAIDFQFNEEGNAEGWGECHSLSAPVVQNGVISMAITGHDPYFVRSFLRLRPDQYSKIRVRMKLPPCNSEAQFFWTTSDSPRFADDKYMNFPVTPDGEWHEYEIPVGTHEKWRGKAIRAIRLDPTTGGAQPGAKVEIDWIVGE